MQEVVVYVLVPTRKRGDIEALLDHFIPDRVPAACEYEYPQFADNPDAVFMEADALLDRLERESRARYSTYWDSRRESVSNKARQAIVFYTEDDGVIFGLAVPESAAHSLLKEMRSKTSAQWGFVTGDECLPSRADEFRVLCTQAKMFRLVDGELKVAN